MSFCTKPITQNSVGCDPNAAGITAITIQPIGGDAVTLDTIPEQSHVESAFSFNPQNRSGFWNTSVFIKVGELSETNRAAIESMALNNVILLLTLVSGGIMVVGSADHPAYMSAGNLLTGTMMDDNNGMDATFSARSVSAPEIVSPVTRTLTFSANNGTVYPVSYTGPEGSTVIVTVTPNDGYVFQKWNDNLTNNPRTFTVGSSNQSFTANCVEGAPSQVTGIRVGESANVYQRNSASDASTYKAWTYDNTTFYTTSDSPSVGDNVYRTIGNPPVVAGTVSEVITS